MKIIKIELNNWCQYEDDHVLEFGKSPDKNVVLIHADNDVGKSSLFYSIPWCLFGRQPDKWKKKDWPLYPLPWLHKAYYGEEIMTAVSVTSEHDESTFCATRSFRTQRTEHGATTVDRSFVFTQMQPGGNWIKAPEDKLYRILPPTVMGYFIFDAETIEHFVNQNENVQQSVRRLLDIEDAERGLEHLETVSSELRKESLKHASNKAKELADELTRIENRIAEGKHLIDNKENGINAHISLCRTKISEIDAQLLGKIEVHTLAQEQKRFEDDIHEAEAHQIAILKRMRACTQSLYVALSLSPAKRTLEYLEEKRIRGELPKNIKSTFITERLNIGKCICGTTIKEGSDQYECLCRFRDSLSDQLSDVSTVLNGDLRAIIQKVSDLKGTLRDCLQDHKKCIDNLKKLNDGLRTVRAKLTDRKDVPEVPELQAAKERYENDERELQRKLIEAMAECEKQERRRDTVNALLQDEKKRQKTFSDAERNYLFSRDVILAIKKATDAFKLRARKYIEEQCNILAKDLFWREDIYEIQIDDKYCISVRGKNTGPIDVLTGMSMGITQMTGIALIASLARQTQCQAPLIMDTPFARLSPAHITRALRECPRHFQQWILFLQPSEWKDSEYRRVISDRILKEYTLERDNKGDITTPRVGYHPEFFGKVR